MEQAPLNKLINAVKRACEGDEWLQAHPPKVEISHYDDAYEYHFENRDIIDSILESGKALGIDIEVTDDPAACDVRHMGNTAQIPAVVYGPANLPLAHQVNEWASADDLIDGAKVIALTALRWCK